MSAFEEREEPLWRADEERFVDRRANYLKRLTDLDRKKARVLAYSELGYSSSGIAKRVQHTAGTVEAYLEKIALRFGIETTLAKRPGEIQIDAAVEPTTVEEVLEFPQPTREQWREIAEKYPNDAPDWVPQLPEVDR